MAKGNWSWLRKEFEQRLGITVADFARLLGAKRQRVDNWAGNRNDPDFLNTLLLAYFFANDSAESLAYKAGVDWDSLINDINSRAEQLGIELPAPKGSEFASTLYKLFDIQDIDALSIIAEYFNYSSGFQQLHDMARRLLKETLGREEIITARLWFYVAYAELMLGRAADAIKSAAKVRELFRPEEDERLLADTYWLSGESERVIGRYNKAYSYLQKAARIYRRLDVKPTARDSGPMWVEWDLGRLECSYGRYNIALRHFERLSKMAQETGLAEAAIIAIWSRACVDEEVSDFNSAFTGFSKASEFAYYVGNKFWEAQSLRNKAEIERKMGRYEDAIETALSASKIYESIGNEKLSTHSRLVIAASYLQMGDPDEAYKLYYEAATIYEKARDEPMMRMALLGLEFARLVMESRQQTPGYAESLLSLRDMNESRPREYDVYYEAYERLALAEALRLTNNLNKAHDMFLAIAEACDSYGHKLEKAHALLGIAETKRLIGDADKENCNRALEIYRKVGSKWGEVHTLIALALIKLERGNSASPFIEEALMIAQEASLKADVSFVESLVREKPVPGDRHVLVFI